MSIKTLYSGLLLETAEKSAVSKHFHINVILPYCSSAYSNSMMMNLAAKLHIRLYPLSVIPNTAPDDT